MFFFYRLWTKLCVHICPIPALIGACTAVARNSQKWDNGSRGCFRAPVGLGQDFCSGTKRRSPAKTQRFSQFGNIVWMREIIKMMKLLKLTDFNFFLELRTHVHPLHPLWLRPRGVYALHLNVEDIYRISWDLLQK